MDFKKAMMVNIGIIEILLLISILMNFNKETIIAINIGVIVLVALRVVLFKGFMYSIVQIIENAQKLYKGELNIDDTIIHNNRDFEILAKLINTLKSNLLFSIDNTKIISTDLANSFDICNKNIDVSCVGSNKIKKLMENVSHKIQEEFGMIDKSFQLISTISDSIASISDDINDVKKSVEDLNETSKDATDDFKEYSDNIIIISKSMNETKTFITQLKEELEKITKVVDFIKEISGQLQLLSLNASIESARCGEAGKGFSVIAGEITDLANTTNEGIEKINIFISNIDKNSVHLENSLKASIYNFEKGSLVFRNVKEIFDKIREENTNMLYSMEQVISEMNNIDNIVKENTYISEKIKITTKEVTEETSNVYAIAEEMLSNNNNINEAALQLGEMTNKLKESIDVFNIGIKPIKSKSQKKLKINVITINKNRGLWLSIKKGISYAKKELEELNADVEMLSIIPGDSPEDQINLLKKCIEEKPDGICIIGNMEEYIPMINDAFDKGMYTITFNNDFKGKCKRISCVQQNQYQSGFIAGEELANIMKGSGKVAVFTYSQSISSMEERVKGFENAIKEHRRMEIVDYVYDSQNEEEALKIFRGYLKSNKDKIKGIFFTARYKLKFAEVIRELNLENKIKVAVYDLCPETVKNIKDDVFSFAINQDGFGQGHDSVVRMYNYLMGDTQISDKIWSRIEVINKVNCNLKIN